MEDDCQLTVRLFKVGLKKKKKLINFTIEYYLELFHSQEFELRRDIFYSSWRRGDLYGKNKSHGEYNTGRFNRCRRNELKTSDPVEERSPYL